MNTALSELLRAWRSMMPLRQPPFILKGDEAIRDDKWCHPYGSYLDFIKDRDSGRASPSSNTKLHTGLIPIPYSGDIAKAKIYILALNPGFNPRDYYAEQFDHAHRQERIRQLEQRDLDPHFPWPSLNPEYCWSGNYWSARLHDVAIALADQRGIPFSDALSELSKMIACLEFVPYHSRTFGLPKRLVKRLHSTDLMRAFVDDFVVPRTRDDDAIIIVTRHVNRWGLRPHRNIITYAGPQSRAAYLNRRSPGGKRIAEMLGIRT